MVRATVVLVEVRVFARLRVNAFAVEVSILTPALELLVANVFVPVPSEVVTLPIVPATP